MGTNYHWLGEDDRDPCDPEAHVGKVYSAGHGMRGFIWAQPITRVVARCLEHADEPAVMGDEVAMTGRVFLQLIDSIDFHDVASVGEWFC